MTHNSARSSSPCRSPNTQRRAACPPPKCNKIKPPINAELITPKSVLCPETHDIIAVFSEYRSAFECLTN